MIEIGDNGPLWIPFSSWIISVAVGILVLYVYFYILHEDNRRKEMIVTMTESEAKKHDHVIALQGVRVYIQARENAVQTHRQAISNQQKELIAYMSS